MLRAAPRVLKRSRSKQGKEKKRSKVFVGARRRRKRRRRQKWEDEEEEGLKGLPAVNTAARDKGSSDSADSAALLKGGTTG